MTINTARVGASLLAVCAFLTLAACERSTDQRGTPSTPPRNTGAAPGGTTSPGTGSSAPNNKSNAPGMNDTGATGSGSTTPR